MGAGTVRAGVAVLLAGLASQGACAGGGVFVLGAAMDAGPRGVDASGVDGGTDGGDMPDAGRPDAAVPDGGGLPDAGDGISYHACFVIAAIDRVQVDRVDHARDRCTRLLLSRGGGSPALAIDAGPDWSVERAATVQGGCDRAFRMGQDARTGSGSILVHEEMFLPRSVDLNALLGFPAMGGTVRTVLMQATGLPVAPDCTQVCLPDPREQDDTVDQARARPAISAMGAPVLLPDLTACPGDDDLVRAYSDMGLSHGAEVAWDPLDVPVELELLDDDGRPLGLEGALDSTIREPGYISLRKGTGGGYFHVRVRAPAPVTYDLLVIAPVLE